MSKLILHISGIDELTKEASQELINTCEIHYVNLDSDDALKASLNTCDVFWFRLNHKLTRAVLKNVKCKYILCAVTGLDHIDIDACKGFGIKVISLKGEAEFLKQVRATAEHTFGLMLALTRNIKEAFYHVDSKQWNRALFQGTELYKKKIGILGLGRLGEIVAEYAEVFGMQVYYYDIKEKHSPKSFIKCDTIESLFTQVDIVSIHVPYNSDTHGLVNKDILKLMKPTASVINASRGGVINEKDLLESLQNKVISGYATDVLFGEPEIEKNPLVTYSKTNNNLIITPHIGGYTYESVAKTERFIAKKLFKLLNE